MAVKVIDRGWDPLRKGMKAIKDSGNYVKVGVLGSSKPRVNGDPIDAVSLAVIHEFGSPAAGIPERSFIRSSFEIHRGEYFSLMRQTVPNIYAGKATVKKMLEVIGLKAANDIKHGIKQEGIPPPNATSTVLHKHSDKPLVDTGQLVNSISWSVVDRNSPDFKGESDSGVE